MTNIIIYFYKVIGSSFPGSFKKLLKNSLSEKYDSNNKSKNISQHKQKYARKTDEKMKLQRKTLFNNRY